MSSMIEILLEHDDAFENTLLTGESSDLILRRLFKALAISHLWIWCEPNTGVYAGVANADLALAIAAELESELTLVPGSLKNILLDQDGDLCEKLEEVFRQAWRLPSAESRGIIFCFSQVQLMMESSESSVLRAFQNAQKSGVPFFVVVVGDDEFSAKIASVAPPDFFTRSIRC